MQPRMDHYREWTAQIPRAKMGIHVATRIHQVMPKIGTQLRLKHITPLLSTGREAAPDGQLHAAAGRYTELLILVPELRGAGMTSGYYSMSSPQVQAVATKRISMY